MERAGPERDGDLVGAVLDGRYRVGAVLARGGTSTVYRGVDTRLDRPVAVKVMDPAFAADPTFLSRFEREARAAARLHHPGVVGVYDQGIDHTPASGRRAFLVMELVDGATLRELLREHGELPVPLALSVTEQVLSALAAAHREGLVHRDVKPENVLIGPGGVVKVADFGLVRAVAEASSTTGDVILGTVAYLSPEQVATGGADARSDVYAAGILLFELLTGMPPYTGETALSVAYRHVHEDVPSPGSTGIAVPPALDELVVAATRRDPAARPPDAAAFLAALRRVRTAAGIATVVVPLPSADTVPVERPGHARHAAPAGGGTATALASPPTRRAAAPGGTRALTRGPDAPRRMPAGSAPAGPGAPPYRPGPYRSEPGDDPWARERLRNRRAFIAWVLVVLLLATAIGVSAWWLGSGRYTSVPELSGQDRAGVAAVLADADLDLVVLEDHNDTVPAGTVISAEPGPGTRALRGSDVDVVLSLGRPAVPRVDAAADPAQVEQTLRDTDLTPVRDRAAEQFHDTVPAGSVIELRPAAGTVLTVGAPVTIVVSKGSEPVSMPDVRGLPELDAVAVLAERGLIAVVEREFDADVAAGAVIDSEPAPGEETSRGSEVTVLVNEALVVPDVIGRSWPDASAELIAQGFSPEQTGDGAGSDGATVSELDPQPGSSVDPGDNRVEVEMTTDVVVPDVEGLTVAEARRLLEELGLRVQLRQIFGDESSPVRGQSPDGGDTVRSGSRVRLSTF